MSKQFDIILFGATSFVGKILIKYLTQLEDKSFSWAVAGRSELKFREALQEQKLKTDGISFFNADSHNEDSLRELCRKTKVIISTVGPYALYGEKLIKACVNTGVDYCDLTGEPQWIVKMIERYEAEAKRTGARIVHCCGFDSVPTDVGVYYLQKCIRAAGHEPATNITMRVKAARGGMSGGTVASLLNVMEELGSDSSVKETLRNPYCLSAPNSETQRVRQYNQSWAHFDKKSQSWTIPFIMAAINVRVVLRSQSLAPAIYGSRLYYDEAMMVGRGIKGRLRAYTMSSLLALFLLAAAFKPTRWLLKKTLLPKPGQGPTPQEQENGFYDLRFFADVEGEAFQVKVVGDRDPGYGSTAKILGQVAIALAKKVKQKEDGGFWTPATLLGESLLTRLPQYAGVIIERVGDKHKKKRAKHDEPELLSA